MSVVFMLFGIGALLAIVLKAFWPGRRSKPGSHNNWHQSCVIEEAGVYFSAGQSIDTSASHDGHDCHISSADCGGHN